jgi:hypothetical protein
VIGLGPSRTGPAKQYTRAQEKRASRAILSGAHFAESLVICLVYHTGTDHCGGRPMLWETWLARWRAAVEACERLGGETAQVICSPPATSEQITEVEQELELTLPSSLRSVLQGFASRVEVYWALPDDADPPGELGTIFAGNCSWNLHDLVAMNASHREVVRRYFTDDSDKYQRLWRNTLVFQEVQNGDRLVVDLKTPDCAPVIYLSPFRGPGSGYTLGEDFADFIDGWTQLGCPGPEIWQMLPFISSPSSGVEPYGKNAQLWRDWLGVHV